MKSERKTLKPQQKPSTFHRPGTSNPELQTLSQNE